MVTTVVVRRWLLACLCALTVVVLMASCALAPQKAPTVSELVGSWYFTGADQEVSTMVLSADGTFTIDQIPPEVFSPKTENQSLNWKDAIPLFGTWSLSASGNAGKPALDFRIKRSSVFAGFMTYLGISGSGDSRALYYYYGDPDNGNRVDYTRSK